MSSLFTRFPFKSVLARNSAPLWLKARPALRPPPPPLTWCAWRALPSWGPPRQPVDRKDVEFRVLQTMAKHDKIDANSIRLDSHLMEDLGLDSLDVIECVVHLEDEFKVEISDVDSERLLTVGALVDHLCAHFEAQVDENQRPPIEFKENMTENRPVN